MKKKLCFDFQKSQFFKLGFRKNEGIQEYEASGQGYDSKSNQNITSLLRHTVTSKQRNMNMFLTNIIGERNPCEIFDSFVKIF